MKKTPVKFNYRSTPAGKGMVSIMCNINYGYKTLHPDLLLNADRIIALFPGIKSLEECIKIIRDPHAVYEVNQKHITPALEKILQWGGKGMYKYEPALVSTGLILPKAFWSQKEKKATGTYKYINERIKEFESYVIQLYNSISENGSIEVEPKRLAEQVKLHISSKLRESPKHLKGRPKISLPTYFGGSVNGVPTVLTDYIDYKIKQFKVQPYEVSLKKPGTIRIYKRFMDKLIDYKKRTSKEFDLLTVSNQQIKDMVEYYAKLKKEDGTEYSSNYLQSFKKEFKLFIEMANSSDNIPYSPNYKINDKWFGIRWQKEYDPYLTIEQQAAIKELKFGKKPKGELLLIKQGKLKYVEESSLEIIRDMLIADCLSGFRFSDLKNLKHLIQEGRDYYFVSVNQKTDQYVRIKVSDTWLIDRYEKKYKKEFKWKVSDRKSNVTITEQAYNRGIKVIGYRAGFTQPYFHSKKSSLTGEQLPVHLPFFQLMKSKIGRKSLATNAVKALLPLDLVAKWTGHVHVSSLKTYIQLSPQEWEEIDQLKFKRFNMANHS